MTTTRDQSANPAAQDSAIDAVHHCWFGELDAQGLSAPRFHALWFTKSESTDQMLQRQFGDLLPRARRGELDTWIASDRGLIALIVLLDQFSRNIHRDTPDAFSADDKALALALQAIAAGRHLQLPLIHRVFLYLPLEHCEDLAIQEQCVSLFDALVAAGGEAMAGYAQYAVAHRDVIKQFGRFPHRNHILGRTSSQAELDYLETHGGF